MNASVILIERSAQTGYKNQPINKYGIHFVCRLMRVCSNVPYLHLHCTYYDYYTKSYIILIKRLCVDYYIVS